MSGHSKWSQIKRQKAVADQKRGNLFTKHANTITVAVKQGGKDPATNFKLRIAVDNAKSANMPNDNIERAIKRGSGELEGATLEEIVYEGFGPAGVAIIVEATTDNKNRTAAAVKNAFAKYQGNLGNSGSALWMFKKKGVIRIAREVAGNTEDFTLKAIDAGAEDVIEEDEGFIILTEINKLADVKSSLENTGLEIASADIELLPDNKVAIDNEKQKNSIQKLLGELETIDDVNNYFTNANI